MPSLPDLVILPARLGAFSALALAAWSDLAIRRISNRACGFLALSGIMLRLGFGPRSALLSAGGAAALFTLLLLPYARGMLGGGDVKLLAAAAFGLAPAALPGLIGATALAGGVLAFAHLGLRHAPPPAPCRAGAGLLGRVCSAERWRIRRHGPLPYGIAIACGAAWSLRPG